MKRSALRRRTPLRRGTRRLGQAARERVRAGGPISKGRPALSLAAYRALVARVMGRANHRCECCGHARSGRPDPHHVIPRAGGGEDSEANVVALCRACHERVTIPYRRGRLLIAPLGGGAFCYRIVVAEHKWAPQAVVSHEHTPTLRWLLAEGVPAGLRLQRMQANSVEVAACPRRGG